MPINKENLDRWIRQRREKRRREGLCLWCGDKETLGKSLCSSCAYKCNVKSKEHYARNRGKQKVLRKNRRLVWLENNQCFSCGAPLIEEEKRYCVNCLIRQRTSRGGTR